MVICISPRRLCRWSSPNAATDNANGSVTGTPNTKYLTEFGEFDTTTGVWKPIEYDGTYGTGGFYLDFPNNSSDNALGNDAAGSNNWSVSNINASSVGRSAVVGAWTSGWWHSNGGLCTRKHV